jgi:hypothetical protein
MLRHDRALIAAATLLAAACASEVGDVDRTQANRIRKSIFDGEWYFRQTTIGVPYTAGFTFVGEQGETERIRWEIQEDVLVAYRTYERVEGSERSYRLPDEDYRGAPIAAYTIREHFDIQREYNAQTGEETNVVVENSVDRPWYDRAYMRVDWSKNLVSQFNFLDDQVDQDPADHFVQKPDDPDRFLVGVKDTDGTWTDHQDLADIARLERADYLDVVERIFARPESYLFEFDGELYEYPACWLYGSADCFPSEIVIRSSFLKVDADSDYESLHYPDNLVVRDEEGKAVRDGNGDVVRVPMFDKFGYFRVERERYTPRRGETESGRVYDICRFNIWKDSRHRSLALGRDATAPFVTVFPAGGRGQEDWRAGVDVVLEPGSTVTLRVMRGGEELEAWTAAPDALEAAINDGSERIRVAVTARGALPDAPVTASSVIPAAQREPRSIVYHLSPDFPAQYREMAQEVMDGWNDAFVRTVEGVTGRTVTAPVVELRDNSYAVDDAGGLAGRGERIGDLRYNFLYWVAEPQAAGPLGYGPNACDPVTGEVVSAFAGVYGPDVETYSQTAKDIVDLLNQVIDPDEFIEGENVAAEVTRLVAGEQAGDRARPATTLRDVQALHQSHVDTERVKEMKRRGKDVLRRRGSTRARLSRVHGTGLDDLLLNDEVRRVRGRGDPAATQGVPQALAPGNWAHGAALRAERERMRILARGGVTHKTFADDSVKALAFRLRDKDPEEVFDIVANAVFRSVAEHELGHTFGLRHNFEASFDPLNYGPDYWSNRPPNPAWLDDESHAAWLDARKRQALPEHQYASVMDYAAKFNSDTSGLGLYDHAAIAFGYGQLVEVFERAPDEPLIGSDVCRRLENRPCTFDDVLRKFRHYTEIPQILGGVDAIHQRRLVPYAEVVQARLDGTPAPPEVPYRFCSDEYAGGTATCNMYDEGADNWEIVEFAAQNYRNYYIFNNFRRDRRNLDVWNHFSRVYERYFSFAQIQYQHWAWQEFDLSNAWEALRDEQTTERVDLRIEDVPWGTALGGGAAMTAAVHTGLNMLHEVVVTPDVGSYYYDPEDDLLLRYTRSQDDICGPDQDSRFDPCGDLYIPIGSGRYPITEFDFDSGYYYFDRVKWVGAFWDKLAALIALADPETYFLGIDADADVQSYAISFNLMFPGEMSRLFGGMTGDDFKMFAGVLDDGEYKPISLLDDPADHAAQRRVDPDTSFTLQLYALYFGMALFTSNFDQTFNDAAKIWLEGAGEAFTPGPNIAAEDIATFVNPFNGRIYTAVHHQDRRIYSTGFQMVTTANTFADAWRESPTEYARFRLTNLIENMELVRGMYQIYGSSWW